MFSRIPFSWGEKKNAIIWSYCEHGNCGLWVVLCSFCPSISSFVFHVGACVLTIVSGYHMLNKIVLHSDLFPAWKLFENGRNKGEKHSHHLRNSHSRVLKGFLSDLPSLPRKGIVTVTAQRRVLQQENHMGCKIKISITGEESRQQRSVYTELLFSLCLLEKVGNALSLQRWCCEVFNAQVKRSTFPAPCPSLALLRAATLQSPVGFSAPSSPQPGSCSSLAKLSRVWPSACLPAPGAAQEGRLCPQQGQQEGQVTPSPRPTAPSSPSSEQSSASTARPVTGPYLSAPSREEVTSWCPKPAGPPGWDSAAHPDCQRDSYAVLGFLQGSTGLTPTLSQRFESRLVTIQIKLVKPV